ncbi:MAG: ABC-F family ATP-binding cassette domain-containing protein [Oligoflexia bacterium]|nr:ABC-F family ATP-binding cassette domain-containing protein [Oligoflexia bacterium]
MSNLLQVQAGTKSYGPRVLFNDTYFAINEEEHVGVIGPNGAGKTTLFKILTNQETLDSGNIVKSKSLRIGYLAQHDQWGANETVEEYLSKDCVSPLWELKALGNDLGLTEELFAKPITSLSGGYRMRCKLLYLIGQEPSLMLLDEPTNYLDLETTLVLEKFLQGYKGAFLLISHDREFLRRTTDHVLEIETGDITKFNGNLDDYFEQKEMLRSQLEARALSLKEKRDEVLQFVARFGAKASKAKQAQSRLKSLNKMETIELKALPVTAAIKLPPPIRTGKLIMTIDNANLGYGDHVVLKNVNYKLQNGDHLAVVGLNGAGKSTFLKVLAQVMSPLSGKVETGYQVSVGYYAQHVAENLNSKSTVIEAMMAKALPEVTRQEGLNMAGSLLFSGDAIQKKISVLSGGEKSRVALGQILLQKAPCLVLDEPTNHLDFQTVEALTQALMKYEGTLVVVSHDRSFIRRVGTKILEINHGEVNVYPGTYDEYVWSLQKGELSKRAASKESFQTAEVVVEEPKWERPAGFNYKETKKNLDRQLKQCEKSVIEIDSQLANLNLKLAVLNDRIAAGSGDNLSQMTKDLVEIQKQIDELESQWLSNSEKKEETLKSLNDLSNSQSKS